MGLLRVTFGWDKPRPIIDKSSLFLSNFHLNDFGSLMLNFALSIFASELVTWEGENISFGDETVCP